MWIDYVKVENDIAYDLLSRDPSNPNWVQYIDWIKGETDIAMHIPPGASEPAVWKFYIELFEFNNIPCIKYVNNIIDSISQGKIGVIADFTGMTGCHQRWYQHKQFFEPERVYRTVVQETGFRHFFAESYPLTSIYNPTPTNTFSKIPNTLPNSTPGNYVLGRPVPPTEYDEWLQDNLDHEPYHLNRGFGPGTAPMMYSRQGDNRPCPSAIDIPQDEGNYRFVMKMGDLLFNFLQTFRS